MADSPPHATRSPTRFIRHAQPDAELAKAASCGDHHAFELLVERYRRPLLGYCRRRLRSDARAEDVVQQTLISAWIGLSSGPEIGNVRGWLFCICRNATIDASRRRADDWQEISPTFASLDSEDEVGRRREAHDLLGAIAGLPGRQREALLRTAIAGERIETVAHSMGVTDGTVRGMLYRARVTMRKAVAAITPPALVPHLVRAGPEVSVAAGSASLFAKGALVVAGAGAIAGGMPMAMPAAHQPHPAASASAHIARPAATASFITAGVAGQRRALAGAGSGSPAGSSSAPVSMPSPVAPPPSAGRPLAAAPTLVNPGRSLPSAASPEFPLGSGGSGGDHGRSAASGSSRDSSDSGGGSGPSSSGHGGPGDDAAGSGLDSGPGVQIGGTSRSGGPGSGSHGADDGVPGGNLDGSTGPGAGGSSGSAGSSGSGRSSTEDASKGSTPGSGSSGSDSSSGPSVHGDGSGGGRDPSGAGRGPGALPRS